MAMREAPDRRRAGRTAHRHLPAARCRKALEPSRPGGYDDLILIGTETVDGARLVT
jgi:hypothetical protein